MKKKLNQITFFLALVTLTFLSGCSSEKIEEPKPESKIIVKEISLKDIEISGENNKLLESVKYVKELKENTLNRGMNTTEFDFYIDQNKGVYLETPDSKSYTFPIYRFTVDSYNIENIIFTLNEDGGYNIFTSKYDVTKEELESPTFDGVVHPLDVNYIAGKVVEPAYCKILMCENDGHGSSGSSHVAGNNCTNTAFLFYVIIYYGGTSSSTTGTTTGTTTGNTSGTGTITSGTTTPGNTSTTTGGITTTPIGGSLNSTQLNFLNNLDVGVASEFMSGDANVSYPVLNFINNCTSSQYWQVKSFLNYITLTGQLAGLPVQQQISLFTYLIQNNFTSQSVAFATNFLLTTNPNCDILDSVKSPYIIDRTAITNAVPGGEKFNAIYKKLTEVPQFKSLFVDMFSDSQTKFNVKFQIANIPDDNGEFVAGVTSETSPGNFLITINSQIMTPTGTQPMTNMEVANVILHESIHAYLMVKALHPNNGVPLPNAENMNVEQLINAIYSNDTTLYPQPVGTPQHNFMIQHMLPTMQSILLPLVNQLTTETKRNDCVGLPLGVNNIWQWSEFTHYLSLQGLEQTNDFQTQFQPVFNSQNVMIDGNILGTYYMDYKTFGHDLLDYIYP